MLPNIHSTDTRTVLIALLNICIWGVSCLSLKGPWKGTLDHHTDRMGFHHEMHVALVTVKAQTGITLCCHAVCLQMVQKDRQSRHWARQHFGISLHGLACDHYTWFFDFYLALQLFEQYSSIDKRKTVSYWGPMNMNAISIVSQAFRR